MKQIKNWLQILGDTLAQLENMLKGRPALQPVPIRIRSVNSPAPRQ